jgi:hypothetical protein
MSSVAAELITELNSPEPVEVAPLPDIPEIPEMRNLEQLFGVPDFLELEDRNLMERVSQEIVEKIKLPASQKMRTIEGQLSSGKNVGDGSSLGNDIESYERDTEALGLLDSLVSFSRSLQVSVEEDEAGGIHLGFKKRKKNKKSTSLGFIGGQEVGLVEVGIKPDREDGKRPKTLQLNFRFETREGLEIESLRVDLHTVRGEEKIDPAKERVEADIGSSIRHEKIESLGEGEEARVGFNTFLSVVEVNFAEKGLGLNRESVLGRGEVSCKENLFFSEEGHGRALKTLAKHLRRRYKALGYEEPTKVSEEVVATPLEGALAAVGGYLEREKISNAILEQVGRVSGLEGASNEELVLAWLLGVGQEEFQNIDPEKLVGVRELLADAAENTNFPETSVLEAYPEWGDFEVVPEDVDAAFDLVQKKVLLGLVYAED